MDLLHAQLAAPQHRLSFVATERDDRLEILRPNMLLGSHPLCVLPLVRPVSLFESDLSVLIMPLVFFMTPVRVWASSI